MRRALFVLLAAAFALPTPAASNAFRGDEFRASTEGTAPIDQFFGRCQAAPSASGEIASPALTTGASACASLVVLQCRGRTLTGFHLVRWSEAPLRVRVYTAAHVLNYYNKRLSAPSRDPGIFPFHTCRLALANGGAPLEDVALSPAQFASGAARNAVAARNVRSFSASPVLRADDIAWFDVDMPARSATRSVIGRVSLPVYRGPAIALQRTRVCAAGHQGPGGAGLHRCVGHGLRFGRDGRCKTRTPTLSGFSGGPFVANVAGRSFAVCTISAQWNPGRSDADTTELQDGRGSVVVRYKDGRENSGVRY